MRVTHGKKECCKEAEFVLNFGILEAANMFLIF